MADYYPLIARAIAGLDPNASGESRRALYERARSALISQLRSVEPPLTESEITRERLSLEESIRRVESEAAQRAREKSRAEPKPRVTENLRTNLARPAPKPDAEGASTPSVDTTAGAATPPRSRATNVGTSEPSGELPRSERVAPMTTSRAPEAKPTRTLRVDPPPIPRPTPPASTVTETPAVPPAPPTAPAPPSAPASDAMRGFREVTSEVNNLGRAAAQANSSARKTYANVPSPSPEFDRLEPSMEDRTGEITDYDKPLTGTGAGTRDRSGPPLPKAAKAPRVAGGSSFPWKIAVFTGVALVLIGSAILVGPRVLQSFRGGSTTTADATRDSSLTQRPKIADRVGQSSLDQIAPIAQRVVLYDEDPAEPKGKQYTGTVVWRLDPIKGSTGQPGDIAIRADVDIPERKMKMTMSFRRNTDSALPASHTAELTFVFPPDAGGSTVSNVPGILMKSNEQARGTPLAGLAVKVTDGFFLVGLSNVEADRVRNLQLLKERSWFDVPLVYSNQRRAIIAIEKGAPGERAFNEAFSVWGE